LLGHRLDHVEHAADLVTLALEFAHGLGGVANLGREALDLRDGFTHHFVAFAGLLVSSDGRFRSFLGVTRDFLHRGSHFVHGGGDLVGLDFLIVDPGAGLLGDGRQLFGGTGDLRDAVADAADQLAQTLGHALHRALQLAEFVAALRHQIMRQVAGGHLFGDFQGLVQRNDDLPGNRPCGQQAEG